MSQTCDRHAKLPVIGQSPCAGCEIERLRAENEVLRKDAERFRHLMFYHVDWSRNGKDDDAVKLEFGPYPLHKLRESIDATMSKDPLADKGQ